jgi:glutathione S-transferase
MYAPVVTRFVTYGFTLPGFAQSYVEAVLAHPWMEEWFAAAQDEEWVIEKFEGAAAK